MTRLIVLDRDGVINVDSDQYIKSPEEWIPIPKSLEAIAELNRQGFEVVVVTNQSGIGQKLFDIHALHAIHQKMIQALSQVGGHLAAIFFCPHRAEDRCACRKPGVGMLMDIQRRFHLSLAGVPMVGDSLRDLQAAVAMSARPILVLTGKGMLTAKDPQLLPEVTIHADLAAMVEAQSTS